MIISRKSWAKYSAQQEKIRTEVARKMEAWLNKNGLTSRDEMIAYAKALSDRYGTAAATLAADMYDATAAAQHARVSPAVPAETPATGEVAKVINGSLKQSIEGKLTASALERLVKQAAEDTMVQNAARDRAEFAWIPDGGACAFCLTLGSRGWQRASKDLLNSHAEHIHANCNCEFAIRFDGRTTVAGYDPAALKEMYDNAAPGQNSAAKMKALRRELTQKTLSKSLTLDDFIAANSGGEIAAEALQIAYDTIKSMGAAYNFSAVSVENLGNVKVFDTVLKQKGTWYTAELVINSSLFAGRSVAEVEEIIRTAPGTVCNSLREAVIHEIYHAKMAESVNMWRIDALNEQPGILGISATAEKDALESISEIGVLKERGEYELVPEAGKKLFEEYF